MNFLLVKFFLFNTESSNVVMYHRQWYLAAKQQKKLAARTHRAILSMWTSIYKICYQFFAAKLLNIVHHVLKVQQFYCVSVIHNEAINVNGITNNWTAENIKKYDITCIAYKLCVVLCYIIIWFYCTLELNLKWNAHVAMH